MPLLRKPPKQRPSSWTKSFLPFRQRCCEVQIPISRLPRPSNCFISHLATSRVFTQLPQPIPRRKSPDVHVGPYVSIDRDVEIGPQAVLLAHVVIYAGVKIGSNFFAHAHSVVREYCRIGNNVILQNGVIIGGDGYGFAKDEHGRWQKILQSGPKVLEDDVEVQSNSCVDRASVGETRIARGVKIDNLAQIGHGSSIGENTLLCAQVGLAGSTEIGKNAILAG